MTEAEQVACDALRMAGLGEVADNLAWVKAATALCAYITETLESDTDDCCAACGAMAGYTAHNRGCSLLPLFETRPGWAEAQVEVAHEEALRMEQQRRVPSALGRWAQGQPGEMFTINPPAGMFTGLVGRPRSFVNLRDLGDPLDLDATSEHPPPIRGNRAVIVDQPTAVVKPSEFGHE